MKERPILFNGAMVRAILAGAKTQTRRIVDIRLPNDAETRAAGADWGFSQAVKDGVKMYSLNDYERLPKQPGVYDIVGSVGWVAKRGCKRTYRCPFGEPGDQLWVRESFCEWPAGGQCDDPVIPPTTTYEYAADHPGRKGWTPSIHMPRAASRITLQVTGVCVGRLNAISDDDAKAEGAPDYAEDVPPSFHLSAVRRFQVLWDSINGKRAPWSSNPWVWAVSFKRVSP